MWQPEPGWRPLPGGTGPSTYGVWLSTEDGREVVVKRLVAPTHHDPGELRDRRSVAYWRREAEVALEGAVVGTPGVRGPAALRVDEDDEGITLVHPWVADAGNPGLFTARALGRLATCAHDDRPWLAHDQLRQRLRRTERQGGWRTLERTTAADIADHLWRRREHHLAALDALPQVRQHGDPTPANLPGRDVDDVLAIDWSSLGRGPVGADLGLFALSTREGFDALLEAYLDGLGPTADGEAAALGARVSSVYTALSRAEWALARVADGEGPLAAKYKHPAVAPHLRALQRLVPQVEALL